MTRDVLPDLPQNQRWKIEPAIMGYFTVLLQERRWWGWRTIASSVGRASGGRAELKAAIQTIQDRDWIDEQIAERAVERQRRRAEIPYGTHGAGR